MRTIRVPSGIGDCIWLFQKLIHSGERFHFKLPDGKPQRGKQIFDILPSLAASAEYINMPTKDVLKNNIQARIKNWSEIKLKDFYLSCNLHLEQGKRIETFLPDLKTSFRIDWDTSNRDRSRCSDLLQSGAWNDENYIGLYGSSYSTSRSWGFWDEHKWLELAQLVFKHNPQSVFVVIGAEWDLDLGHNLLKQLHYYGLPHVKVIGEELGTVIEIMKRLKYFFSFPSGLGILAPTVSCNVTMFYPKHLEMMMNAWASPEDIESDLYKGCQFCTPQQIFDWAVDNNKI